MSLFDEELAPNKRLPYKIATQFGNTLVSGFKLVPMHPRCRVFIAALNTVIVHKPNKVSQRILRLTIDRLKV